MRKSALIAAAVGAVACLLVGAVDLRPDRPLALGPVESSSGTGPLRAGAGRAEVELPPGIELAGYRPMGRAAAGGEVPTHARALVLEAGEGRAAVVLLELMTLPPSLVERLRSVLREQGLGCALLVASHTHSGPAGYDRDLLPQLAAVGRFDPEVEGALVRAAADAVRQARRALGPATLTVEEGMADWARNRDRQGAEVDRRWTRLAFTDPSGAPIATLVQATAHPTLSERATGPHGDWPQVAMRHLEEGGGVALVIQGAVGDARAVEPGVERLGEAVAAARGARERLDDPLPLSCAELAFTLPPPDLRGMVPAPLGRLVSNVAVPFAPTEAHVAALRVGPWVWVGIPAEATLAVARELEAPWEELGLRARTVSLAQGYAGYAVRGTDVIENVFSARNAWFADHLAPRLWEAARSLAEGHRHAQGAAASALEEVLCEKDCE